MATQNQDRLRSLFQSIPATQHAEGWDSLWEDASFLPWDRGHANPALIDLLSAGLSSSLDYPPTSDTKNPTPGAPEVGKIGQIDFPPPVKSDGMRLRVLVPGCGKGYDVALFAAHGYDAYGLEVSAHATQAAKRYVGEAGDGPLEGEYIAARAVGPWNKDAKRAIVSGDYFDDAWLGEIKGWEAEKGFDVIYDNTFLCALPPSLRPRWAARTASLLAPSGSLICLEFPTHKPASSGGPPWSLPPTVHAELLKRPGEDIEYNDAGVVVASDRPEAENALVRVAHYTPWRTHSIGVVQGVTRDCVSIWRQKS
ncbi:S-adenosyl-L-methionine-dependent methyltransferase [Dothidotthia symphoricarpi CBS 119687]|uniref:S-adenosyl-L-methionine-dependent methyltransferase n=1 Tax=Dothidotthia symphoricarpi CBS 119687 TaxID=1392245 RepID=A0A6A6ARI1_9PLEO|nr:S-adenosyl-L-methionine-dependent methyltransferase [Dothidotthia symphoricarpi CBS 119687]KAF2133778.1 S-adenosyl-L-methionine-dependent methyltransferase [Dothidotthia symphoricarpi CBS 119687]